jgi:tetratricopeptide (TPR) repeat protein
MTKAQAYLLAFGTILLLALSFLPTSVVENDEATQFGKVEEQAVAPEHSGSLDEALLLKVAMKRKAFLAAPDEAAKAIALDSLVLAFIEGNKYDSAASYAANFAKAYSKNEYWTKAGDLYYTAFEFALSEEKAKEMGEKVREIYGMLLEKQPSLLDLKAKIGMTYIAEAPMKGVTMIREVLAQDPNNQLARTQMAMLSMRSGQYDKAVEHLQTLLKQDPKNLEAQFYLGISYFEMGNKEEADRILHAVKDATNDPNILQTIDKYLSQLHEKEKH